MSCFLNLCVKRLKMHSNEMKQRTNVISKRYNA